MTGRDQLVGRDDDVEQLAELLGEHSIVTILGPGGVGKTSLAVSLADELTSEFPGGTFVVELAGAGDADDISFVAARQLDVDTLASLQLRASGNYTLVILDNCETVLAGASEVAAMLTQSPDVRVLATSRSPLRAAGEHLYPLAPLGLPGIGPPRLVADSPAATLFLLRAQQAGASWAVDEHSLASIARIVRRLDGLPLAIELAAARSRVLSPAELVEHLDHQLDLLARPDEVGRHQSLRGAIGSSYDALPQDLQTLLRRIATLPGSFDIPLVHRVASTTSSQLDTLDRVAALIDASLVDARPDRRGRTSYRLLDSIRAYACEQLEASGEATAAYETFVESMVTVADEILVEGTMRFSTEVLDRIRSRFPHLVAAIHWCLEHDDDATRVNRLVLPFYGPTGARSEAAELTRRIDARWTTSAPLEAEALAVMATVNFIATHEDLGATMAQRAFDHPEATDLARLIALRTLGMIAATGQQLDEAKALFEQALELDSGADAMARELRISWAAVALDPADRVEVLRTIEALITDAEMADEAIIVVWATVTLALNHVLADDIPAARRAAEKALSAASHSGVPWALTTTNRVAASVQAVGSGWDAALPHFHTALETAVAGGDMEGMAMTLRAAAGAARHVGAIDLAAELWATIPLTQGIPVLRSVFHDHEQALHQEFGRPTGTDLGRLAARARSLLGVVSESTAAAPDGDGAIYRFSSFELDLGRHELRDGGEPVHVEPQVFDVIVHLVERAGRLVTKNELLDNVWGDRFVSEAALSSRVAHARKALGDDGKRQHTIRTVHGRGFMFVRDVA